MAKTKTRTKPVKAEIIHQQAQVVKVEATPDNMIMIALQSGRTMEEIKSLIEMRNNEIARIAMLEYNLSFSMFQEALPELVKNRKAGYDHKSGPGRTEYGFHDLAGIARLIKQPLASYGLAYRWDQREEGDRTFVWCIVTHRGGHKEVGSELSGLPDTSGNKNSIQAKISTVSYLQRCTLKAMLGLSSIDPDDDGKGGAPVGDDTQPKPVPTEQFNSTMKKIISEPSLTVEVIKEKYAKLNMQLSEDQEKSLMVAQNARKP